MSLRIPALRATALLALVGLGALTVTARCAKTQCTINSDCGFRRYCDLEQVCRADCAEDRDCENGFCDINGRCQSGAREAGVEDVPISAPDVAAPEDVPAPADVVIPGPDVVVAPMDVVVPRPDVPAPGPDVPAPGPDVPAPMDTFVPAPDVPPPPDVATPRDIPAPPVDLGPAPGAYLDPCVLNTDCASLDCAATRAGARFCTRACTSRRDCGNGYLCAIPAGMSAGRCVLDDTGAPCTLSDNRCARYCYTTTGAIAAHCTRECADGADCPAGFACQPTGGGQPNVCVEVEVPCNRGSECATSVCLGGIAGTSFRGCSAMCRTAADCPRRALIDGGGGVALALAPYTCMTVSGVPVCVPPLDVLGGDIAGSDRVGASCNATPGAINTCRSGLCESPATGTIGTCLQGCNAGGGCPPGFGCAPESDGPGLPISLVCRPSGTAVVGAACARGSDCESAICNVPTGAGTGYCARLCADGICPTGMRCASRGSAVGGGVVSACTR